jgi:hypothetical protein
VSIDPLGLLILALGAIALFRGPSFAFTVFIPCTLLGSAAAITSDTISIQPAHLLLGFVTLAVFSQKQYLASAIEGLSFPLPGFWLGCTLLYGVLGAILFPRLLAGITFVNAIGQSDTGPVFYPIPLGPNSANFTQSVYFCGDVICFLVCYSYARTIGGFRCIFNALIYYCIGNIVFAFLDLVTFWTGTSYLLGFIRNAGYTLHTETVVLGLKRIAGSFTETSSFAGATIGILGFTGRLWLLNIMPSISFPIAMTSLLLLVFSTSSTAYATLPLLLLYFYFNAVWKLLNGPVSKPIIAFVLLSPLLLGSLIAGIFLQPAIAGSVSDLLDVLLFDKSTSQSGMERGAWNEYALRNFFETFGLGAGIGSVRASSFLIAMLANLGVLGSFTYSLFLYKLLREPSSTSDQIFNGIASAARTACLGLLLGAVISGALIDLGLPFFVFAALGCASPLRSRVTHPVQPALKPI